MGKKIVQIKEPTGRVLTFGLVALFAVAALKHFDVIDMSDHVSGIIVIMGSLFVLTEIGKTYKKNALSMVGLVIVGAAMLGAILGFTGVTWGPLSSIQGFVDIGLIVYVLYHAFTK